ncbi:Predicted oxidoreductase [Thermomonospora echinospora]|uniref:Predicted oxidoreductase n=1 Tax=Thermomonospora echinospora TaxID=1992 RepID=A0A1H6DJR4_9ACTN|nr:aldo/keto reductase [Thermomonospora echinospora]SEG85073.1 Predicted oxidoreductase [Thermomonospora echinospora]
MRRRLLGRSGMRVSELCLGTMTFGTGGRGGGADETACREIYAAYREAGGNFVDTADIYTAGQSESIVGRLVAGERDSIVLATKFTLPTDAGDANSGGGHRKSLRRSVETSLRRLGTDYVDLLWVHAWDQCTPGEETLRALDDLVRSGKVLAIGVSNTPAWVVARSQAIAELRGWSAFCALQIEYSLVSRSVEREFLPMAQALGLTVTAWSPLARGLLAGKTPPARDTPLAPSRERVANAVAETAKVAAELGTTSPSVALAWLLGRGVIPVLGASRQAQIRDNLGAAGLRLDDAQTERLDAATRIGLGYPYTLLNERFPMLSAAAYAPGR